MKRIAAICVAAAFLFACGCSPAPLTDQSFAMDTVITQTAYTEDAAVFARNNASIRELESAMSKTLEGSDIYRLNHMAGGVEFGSEQCVYVLERSLEAARETGGTFNPALGAVTDAWGFHTENTRVPDGAELRGLLQSADYAAVKISGMAVDAHGAAVDLGGAAKGYALDAVKENMEQSGVGAALVSVGGSVYARGQKPGGKWKVGVRDPFGNAAQYIAVLELQDVCVSTSGIYERGFERDGAYYHHILDPKTGYPADNGLVSVSVVDENGLFTDIYSTALFVMGPKDGLAYANECGIDAIFITEDKRILLTDGFGYGFALKDNAYHVS